MPSLPTILRFLAGLITGLVLAFALLIAIEIFSNIVHPFPADFMGTHEEICAHVARYPQWILAVAVPAWAFTAYAGTWTAKRLAGSTAGRAAAITVGLLLSVAVIFNVSMLPYPLWFKILAVVGVLSAAGAAIRPRS